MIPNETDIYHHFQPIFNIREGKRLGYEILLRSNRFTNPEQLFTLAKTNNVLYEVDTMAISSALSTARSLGLFNSSDELFLNIYPSTIINPGFRQFIQQLVSTGLIREQKITFELSETESVNDYHALIEEIHILKQYGIKIALDDVGKGKAYIKDVIELEPYYIKLDRYLSLNLYQFEKKQSFIYFILEYCKRYNISVVLEGLETTKDLEIAQKLDIPYAQGFLLGKPTSLTDFQYVSNG